MIIRWTNYVASMHKLWSHLWYHWVRKYQNDYNQGEHNNHYYDYTGIQVKTHYYNNACILQSIFISSQLHMLLHLLPLKKLLIVYSALKVFIVWNNINALHWQGVTSSIVFYPNKGDSLIRDISSMSHFLDWSWWQRIVVCNFERDRISLFDERTWYPFKLFFVNIFPLLERDRTSLFDDRTWYPFKLFFVNTFPLLKMYVHNNVHHESSSAAAVYLSLSVQYLA